MKRKVKSLETIQESDEEDYLFKNKRISKKYTREG